MTIKNKEKAINWKNIILRWKPTSLSMTQCCKSENLSIDTFKYWKKQFSTGNNISSKTVAQVVNTSQQTKLVPVKVTEETAENSYLQQYSNIFIRIVLMIL